MSIFGTKQPAKSLQNTPPRTSTTALWFLASALVLSTCAVTIYSVAVGGQNAFELFAVSIFVLGASAFVGGVLGFLFGIPRSLQRDGDSSSDEVEGDERKVRSGYRPNTNLEQISDWLTKILVGVGLTQLESIKKSLLSVTDFITSGVNFGNSGRPFVLSLIVFSTLLGFFFGYLWTRLFLAGEMRIADQNAVAEISERIEVAEKKVSEMRSQTESDSRALNLVNAQISSSEDLPPISSADLTAAIVASSQQTKVAIFNLASKFRSESWRDKKTKDRMERTIPIFRALIQSDSESMYHRNHAQLAYVLKDKGTPSYSEAEAELSKAIDIRTKNQESGWPLYDFNRAFCRIMQDVNFRDRSRSEPTQRESIVSDLCVAGKSPRVRKIIQEDTTVGEWMKTNSVTLHDIGCA